MDFTDRNVIFLDIDGVLNTPDSHDRFCRKKNQIGIIARHDHKASGDHVDVGQLNLLKHIIESTNALVIIVSSWVHGPEDVAEIANLLSIPAVGKTDYTGGGTARGESVLRWLEINKPRKFLIIDDAGTNMYQSFDPDINKIFWTNMIYCHGAIGLLNSDVAKAIYHFNT